MKKYKTKSLEIIWEPEKCIHSAICIKGLPSVFNLNAKPWINIEGESEEKITAQINKCPSGALSCISEGDSARSSSKPIIAEKSPAVLELDADKKYAWCTCGKSNNQPWCDGSHSGTDFTPKIFSVKENKKFALCRCKATSNPPFCDGTHSKL
jgi:CDGSH-type Zn-finger protein/uncharacterized Fe-S cluster protein YjdI